MTTIYFVRHAKPDENWMEDSTRPLTKEGEEGAMEVTECLKEIPLTYAVSSPYKRSMDTIAGCVKEHGLTIHTDSRFRERDHGTVPYSREFVQKRWEDHSFHEPGGESLDMVEQRNVEGLMELLSAHEGETIIFGTHGTALSTIFHHFDPSFGFEDFLRIRRFLPYIVKMTFEKGQCLSKEEILIVRKFS